MQTLEPLVFAAFFVASISAFFILLLGKTGLRDKIILKAPVLISKLFDCDFCLSFWTSLILAAILAIILGEPRLIIIPTVSTPLTRILL